MSYDLIGRIFASNILIHIEASIQECSKLVVQNPGEQARSAEHKSTAAAMHNNFLQNTFFC